MGIGDALIASGEARKLHKASKLKVLIVDRHGRPYWSDMWNDVPYILRKPTREQFSRLMNGSGFRPYIALKTPERWKWRPFAPTPAQIVFTPEELAFAEPYRGMIMVEPNVKDNGHDNKAWVKSRWREVITALVPDGTDIADSRVVQCSSNVGGFLDEVVHQVVTPSFRHAAAVLSVAKLFVGTEGGLMHAAAATGTPAVILWSEFISPGITGYSLPTITNLRHAGKACGMRTSCPGCRKSMNAITVDEVLTAIKEKLA